MLLKIIHSRKLLNKLPMNFITLIFKFNTKLLSLYVFSVTLILCYC